MSIQIIGKSGTVAAVDGSIYNALTVTVRPVEYGLLGSYRVAASTSESGSGAAVYMARWSSLSAVAVIWGVRASGTIGTSNATYQAAKLSVLRSFTADPTGGSTITPSRLSTRMRPSLMLIRSGTGLTGTFVEDSTPIGQIVSVTGATSSGLSLYPISLLYGSLERYLTTPIVLVNNEGLVIDGSGANYTLYIDMGWSEVVSY